MARLASQSPASIIPGGDILFSRQRPGHFLYLRKS